MKTVVRIKALLWKNYIIQKNSHFCTVVEILFSVIFALLLLLPSDDEGKIDVTLFKANQVSGKEFYIEPKLLPPYRRFGIRYTNNPYHLEYEKIYFSPNTVENIKLMGNVVEKLKVQMTKFLAKGFPNEKHMLNQLFDEYSKCKPYETLKCKRLLGGVIIHKNLDIDNNLNYTIRMPNVVKNNVYILTSFKRFDDYSAEFSSWNTNLQYFKRFDEYKVIRSSYWYSGFLTLQRAIDMSWMEMHTDENQLKQLNKLRYYTKRMAEKKTKLKGETGRMLVLYVLYYIYWISAIITAKMVASDKEDGMKEYMKAMGLNNWVQWLANFIYSTIKLTVMCLIVTTCLCAVGNGFGKSDITIVFFFLLVNAISVNCWAFAMAVSFNSTVHTVLVVAILYFLLSVISANSSDSLETFDHMNYVPWTASGNMFPMLINNFALAQGVKLITFYELKGIGMKWVNFFQPPRPYDTLSMGLIILTLVINCIICFVYAWYVDAVAPGPRGLPQKPWFFLQRSYWTGIPPKEQVKFKEETEAATDDINLTTVEPMSPLKEPSITMSDIVKVYDDGKLIALNEFSLYIYPDQITSILGHNAAGKSTAMKIMTGVLPASSGKVHIDGTEFTVTSMQTVREKMGFCPQENILFSTLTVEQHLQIFFILKKGKLDQSEADRIIKCLGFGKDCGKKAEYLSYGGMRKLLVGMAFVGDAELIFLDEPSSGMDPATRQMMWNFIRAEKANKTIVLITHFMEEADVLGDRIAIMANGQLRCVGSGLFLKKHYGIGYNLKVSFDTELNSETNNSKSLMDLIVRYCPDASLESELENEATIVLPQQYGPSFPGLFQDIEENEKQLKIKSFGVAITTLEDVFLRVVQASELDGENDPLGETEQAAGENTSDYHQTFSVPNLQQGYQLQIQQLRGMFLKKFQLATHNISLCLLQLLLPSLCVILTFTMTRANEIFGLIKPESKTSDMPPLEFNMMPFGLSNVLWQKNTNTGIAAKLADSYKDFLSKQQLPIRNISYINADQYMLSQYDRYPQYDIERLFIVGAIFESDYKVVAYYQGMAQHSVAIATNLLDNVIVQYVVNDSNVRITTVNHPLPKDIWTPVDFLGGTKDKNKNAAKTWRDALSPVNTFLLFGLACSSSSFAIQYGDEATSLTKHLQLLTGTHLSIYWISHFLFDASISLTGGILAVIIMVVLNVRPFTQLWGTLLWLVVLFCTSMVIRGCFLTRMSQSKVYLFIINFVIAMNCFLLGFSLVNMDNYVMGKNDICMTQNCTSDNTKSVTELFPFNNEIIVFTMIFFAIQIVLYSFRLATDLQIRSNSFTGKKLMKEVKFGNLENLKDLKEPEEPVPDDNDVVDEAEIVSNITDGQNIPLFTRNLMKVTNQLSRQAIVNNFNIKLNAGDCLGLLGLNGAGKSTIFNMLVGLDNISYGEAQIFGFDVESQWQWAGRNVGFCPQKEAVSDILSGFETLCLFARLRGIPEQKVGQVVRAVIKAVGIEKHAYMPAYTYSGGLKRRLSFGMAIIGLPQLLLLDEPTTGVDPAAKRRVWQIMQQLRQHGLTAVLTSHSMDECDVLCSRIALMVRGRLACLGSSEHLKEKFGAGCTLQVKIQAMEYVEYAQKKIEEAFGILELKEQHQLILTYAIPRSAEWPYSRMFQVMEELIVPLKIADYSLSQTSLHEVFMHFAHDSSIYYKKLHIDNKADMLRILEVIW